MYMCHFIYSFLLQEENDDNYVEEAEVADEFDSDFDEDVSVFLY